MADRTQGALESLGAVRKQAENYLTARYGDGVWFRAPETFGKFEQWVWALAKAEDSMAAAVMGEITAHFEEERK